MTTATTERPTTATKGGTTAKRVTIKELKDEYLSCRDIRHMWGRSEDWNITRNTSGKIIEFTRRLVCMSCKTERHEVISCPSMDIIKRFYIYPPGFLLVGSGQIGASHSKITEVRRETIHRILPNEDLS